MKTHNLFYFGLAAMMAAGFSACSNEDDDISAASVPTAVANTFKEMYPMANRVDWEKQQQWYVADFNANTFDTEAWYNADGTWAMTETDYGMMASMLPEEVYTAFTSSPYSNWVVDDAAYYERPFNSYCVIEVEGNGASDISLFYDTMGILINKVQGDNFYINPNTDPATIVF